MVVVFLADAFMQMLRKALPALFANGIRTVGRRMARFGDEEITSENRYDRAYAHWSSGIYEDYRDAYNAMINEMPDDSPEKELYTNNSQSYQDGFVNFQSAMKRRNRKRKNGKIDPPAIPVQEDNGVP